MGILDLFRGATPKLKADIPTQPTNRTSFGDVILNPSLNQGLFKAFIPNFLYKPPFGYPRQENLLLVRQLAGTPYVQSVVKTLQDEAASTKWSIVYKEEVEPTPELDKLQKEITGFFDNPNSNKESFQHIIRSVVRDIVEIDGGVLVKVFNKQGKMVQIFARDGASFLLNPDKYGYLGNREEMILPMEDPMFADKETVNNGALVSKYANMYADKAAYYQYGFTGNFFPVPYGRREIIYIMQSPRSDSIYGRSGVQVLADIILTLTYGANYNLDFYMNGNMPEGVVSILGADDDQIKSFRERMDARITKKDENTGFIRKVFFKVPVVNQAFTFTPFMFDPKTMQVIEQQTWFSKVLWAYYGITPDEMGFTEDSNRATGQNQMSVYKRKAVRPILNILKYHFDKEIIPEFGPAAFENFEFKWDDYDLDEDIKTMGLYEAKIRMGIMSPEMVAKELGIDYAEVEKYNEQKLQEKKDLMQSQGGAFGLDPGLKAGDPFKETKMESALIKKINNAEERMMRLMELYDKPETIGTGEAPPE